MLYIQYIPNVNVGNARKVRGGTRQIEGEKKFGLSANDRNDRKRFFFLLSLTLRRPRIELPGFIHLFSSEADSSQLLGVYNGDSSIDFYNSFH